MPFQIKKIAVKDCCDAFFAGIKKFKLTGEPFDLSYRTKKDLKQSCFIPKSAISYKGIYHSLSGKLKFQEALPDDWRDSRLLLDHGRWFLMCSYLRTTKQSDIQGRVVALDPGVRTFLTGYSEIEVFKIGNEAFSRIQRLCVHMDALISRLKTAKSAAKRRMKKALNRMQLKISDLISELHFKSARWLCENYDIILLPNFETSDMVRKSNRKIHSKTARNMMTFSHFKFKVKLKSLADELGKVVIDVNEAYTSKTASWTGEIKYNLGSSKRITSNSSRMDRDYNGARGIFLRTLGDTPCLRSYVLNCID